MGDSALWLLAGLLVIAILAPTAVATCETAMPHHPNAFQLPVIPLVERMRLVSRNFLPFVLATSPWRATATPVPVCWSCDSCYDSHSCFKHHVSFGYAIFGCVSLTALDPCLSAGCHLNALCVVFLGNATCVCKDGFNGDGYLCGGLLLSSIFPSPK
jgi:hypothetical protein